MTKSPLRRIVVLVNPRSGLQWSFDAMRRAFDRHWECVDGVDMKYQFTQSQADGEQKARLCVADGVDTVIVVGGDGTLSTIGRILVDTDVALGVVPAGSGNGFARHFGISLNPEKAIEQLATARRQSIDVGHVNGRPFFVTCSMAWDASLVRGFDRMPVRGVLPYVFAGVEEFFDYRPQKMEVELDGEERMIFDNALVFTVANLTQFGGGARIAPHARADDGRLELVVALRQDIAKLVANIARLFDGTLSELPEVVFHSFKTMHMTREEGTAIQVDGELVESGREIDVTVSEAGLRVLVPMDTPSRR
ncbi:MAG: diacylglycerol kinase family lipid kinase [Lentisphaerae bacterium]|nr:diacylglycerol kinase family lipid kinase [Lentisphaerota bacterium]